MGEGYLSVSGRWIVGEPTENSSFLGLGRGAISSTHEDFPERAVQYQPIPIMTSIRSTPIIADHLPSAETVIDILRRAGLGGYSYFEDLVWYGYGLAALTGSLGPTQQARVEDTVRTVESIFVNLLSAPNIPEPERYRNTDSTRYKKACYALAMYANYTLNYGAPEFIGRSIVSYLVGQQIQRFVRIPFSAAPVAWSVHTVALFLATTWGSFIRLAEGFRDEYGSLNDLTALDLMIVSLNGSASPRELRRNKENMKDSLVNRLEELAGILGSAGARSRLDVIRGIHDMTGPEPYLREASTRIRIAAERLDGLPAYNLLQDGDQLFEIMQDVRVEIETLQRRGFWDDLPEDVRSSCMFFYRLFNPAVCNFLTQVFSTLGDAAQLGMVMTVPAATLRGWAGFLNIGPLAAGNNP